MSGGSADGDAANGAGPSRKRRAVPAEPPEQAPAFQPTETVRSHSYFAGSGDVGARVRVHNCMVRRHAAHCALVSRTVGSLNNYNFAAQGRTARRYPCLLES